MVQNCQQEKRPVHRLDVITGNKLQYCEPSFTVCTFFSAANDQATGFYYIVQYLSTFYSTVAPTLQNQKHHHHQCPWDKPEASWIFQSAKDEEMIKRKPTHLMTTICTQSIWVCQTMCFQTNKWCQDNRVKHLRMKNHDRKALKLKNAK